MVEDFVIEDSRFIELSLYKIRNGIFNTPIGSFSAAVCTNCGEVSLYIKDTNSVKEILEDGKNRKRT